jgi:subtilase family serine protease
MNKFVGIAQRNAKTGKTQRIAGGDARGNAQAVADYNPDANPVGAASPLDVGPQDFGVIYNVTPLWNNGVTGAGETIALPEQSEIDLQDPRGYYSVFWPNLTLAQTNPSEVIPPGTTNPGQTGDTNEDEALLDTEVSLGIAYGANIVIVPQPDVTDAISYIVDEDLAPIMSVSFGQCELALGTSGNLFFGGGSNTTGVWQQAAAEGITVLVSAGDGGAAGCDDFDVEPTSATEGLAVSGFASTPYDVAVGGTDFNDFDNFAQYWNLTEGITESALSYIPEMTWNGSCASPILLQRYDFGTVNEYGDSTNEDLCNNPSVQVANTSGPIPAPILLNIIGGSGGVSSCTAPTGATPATCTGSYAEPSWQTGVSGVPSGVSSRMIPDVALFSADGISGHAYVICDSSATSTTANCSNGTGVYTVAEFGGTSASAPAFAAVLALIEQQQESATNLDGRQGVINPVLYQLAATEYGTPSSPNTGNLTSCNSSNVVTTGSTCVFYDTTVGDNTVPCSGTVDCDPANSGDTYGLLESSGSPVYAAGSGYDLATGLGSVNAANLASAWAGAGGAATTTTTLAGPTASVDQGASATFTATVAATSGTPTGSVTFIADGATVLGGAPQVLSNVNGQQQATLATRWSPNTAGRADSPRVFPVRCR